MRSPDDPPDLLRYVDRVDNIDPGQHNQEFVSAVSSQDAALPDSAADRGGYGLENAICLRMLVLRHARNKER